MLAWILSFVWIRSGNRNTESRKEKTIAQHDVPNRSLRGTIFVKRKFDNDSCTISNEVAVWTHKQIPNIITFRVYWHNFNGKWMWVCVFVCVGHQLNLHENNADEFMISCFMQAAMRNNKYFKWTSRGKKSSAAIVDSFALRQAKWF